MMNRLEPSVVEYSEDSCRMVSVPDYSILQRREERRC